MIPLLADPAEFAALVQRFFAERLLQQQAVSPRTVAAYRDTFRLLLGYAERQLGKPPARLALGDVDAELILGFLAHLEAERHNTVRSRNARLAAVRAFARYVALQCPPALLLAQRILAIPMKRFDKPLLGFLSRDEVQALRNRSLSGVLPPPGLTRKNPPSVQSGGTRSDQRDDKQQQAAAA